MRMTPSEQLENFAITQDVAEDARSTRDEFKRLDAEIAHLRNVLDATHKLITEGAMTGFVPTDGTWADRLFKNQGAIHDALNRK